MIAADKIIVAMDILDTPRVLKLVDKLLPLGIRWFKVGLSLWIHDGPKVVDALQERGANVFLDLKLHDIPHQVELATRAAAARNVDLLTVHASGGPEMLRAAVRGAGDSTKILAITVLTSLDAPEGEVQRRAMRACESGVHGVVCSPLEVGSLRQIVPASFLLVTPGVRPAGSATGDQRRVATPEDAVASGSNLLVIGRPITQADDPVAAAQALVTQ
jgi:orotidine-5'-phosphate decarboxylase